MERGFIIEILIDPGTLPNIHDLLRKNRFVRKGWGIMNSKFTKLAFISLIILVAASLTLTVYFTKVISLPKAALSAQQTTILQQLTLIPLYGLLHLLGLV